MSIEFWHLLLWLIVLSIGIFIAYSGWFYDIHVMIDRPQIYGKIKFAYKFCRGPYKNVCKIFSEVGKLAKGSRKIGVYYDDPKVTSLDRCRYAAGVIVSVNGVAEVDEEVLKRLKFHGYSLHEFPQIEKAVVTDFKHTTILSVILAVRRVYGYIDRFKKEYKVEAYPAVEMYFNKKIHFFMPTSNHDEFYVSEAGKHS